MFIEKGINVIDVIILALCATGVLWHVVNVILAVLKQDDVREKLSRKFWGVWEFAKTNPLAMFFFIAAVLVFLGIVFWLIPQALHAMQAGR